LCSCAIVPSLLPPSSEKQISRFKNSATIFDSTIHPPSGGLSFGIRARFSSFGIIRLLEALAEFEVQKFSEDSFCSSEKDFRGQYFFINFRQENLPQAFYILQASPGIFTTFFRGFSTAF